MSNQIILLVALTVTPYKCDVALRDMASKYYATRQVGSDSLTKTCTAVPGGYVYMRKGLWSRDYEVNSRCYAIARLKYAHIVQGEFHWMENVHRFDYERVPCNGCSECNWSGVMWPDSNFRYVVGFASIYFPF